MAKADWKSVRFKQSLPPYTQCVLVVRPNKMTGEGDVLRGRLERAKPEGIMYGKFGDYTFDDFWVVPGVGVLRFDRVTHWDYLPSPPKEFKNSEL